MSINDFQERCKQALQYALRIEGLPEPALSYIRGRSENYLNGHVGKCEFWIYEDGADFVVGERTKDERNHWIYEPQDFDKDSILIEKFVSDLIRELKSSNIN